MRIPEIRERLIELSIKCNLPELDYLAGQLRRRPAVRKTPRKSAKMTDELRTAIETHAILFPDKSLQEIANVFNVNSARVSEVLAGLRD